MYSWNRFDAFFHSVAVELSWVKRWDSKEMRMPGCVNPGTAEASKTSSTLNTMTNLRNGATWSGEKEPTRRLDVADFHAFQDLVVKMSDVSHDQRFHMDQSDDVAITR